MDIAVPRGSLKPKRVRKSRAKAKQPVIDQKPGGMTVVTRPAPMPQAPKTPAPMDPGELLRAIAEGASNPNMDVNKLMQISQLYERLLDRDRECIWQEQMAAAQKQLGRVRQDAYNSQTKSKYATYAQLDRAVRPVYSKLGFVLTYNTETAADGYIRVTCAVGCANYIRHYQIDMPITTTGPKGQEMMTKTHATGSAITYGKRYLLGMIFNIAVGADDDGNAAGGGFEACTEEQIEKVQQLIVQAAQDIPAFVKYFGIEKVADLLAKDYPRAVKALEAKIAQQATQTTGEQHAGQG